MLTPPSRRATLLRFFREPLVFGTLCGLASAVGYTAANSCLRAVSDNDAVWVSSVKAFPTVALFAPWLLLQWIRAGRSAPPWRELGILIFASLVCQVFGNVVFQWSLGVVGMALVVPLTLGAMIVSGAAMGRVFLREPVTSRMAISTLVLIVAICALSFGAGDASRSVTIQNVPPSFWLVMAGVAGACLSGIAYALLGVVIRHVVTDKLSIAATLVTVTLTGVLVLGAASVWRQGIDVLLETGASDFGVMLLAGVFNAAAFLALTKSLQLVPVIWVNALNATQAGMAAVAGILFFSEASSPALWLGVGLTVLGLMLMHRPQNAESDTDRLELSEIAPAETPHEEPVGEPCAYSDTTHSDTVAT